MLQSSTQSYQHHERSNPTAWLPLLNVRNVQHWTLKDSADQRFWHKCLRTSMQSSKHSMNADSVNITRRAANGTENQPRTKVGHHILLAFAQSGERSQSQHPSARHNKNEKSDDDNCHGMWSTQGKKKKKKKRMTKMLPAKRPQSS